jgi:hypothetical protein
MVARSSNFSSDMPRHIQRICCRRVRLLLLFAFIAVIHGNLSGAVVTVSGTVTIGTSAVSSISVGDKFDYTVQINDGAVDQEPSNKQGSFNAATVSVSLSRVATNTGSWNPSGGVFSLTQPLTTSTSSSDISVLFPGTGFPADGTYAFDHFDLNWTGGFTVTDTGSGQTLAQQLGGQFPATMTSSTADLVFLDPVSHNGIAANGPATAAVATPEPGTGGLLLCGAIAVVLRRRRQK